MRTDTDGKRAPSRLHNIFINVELIKILFKYLAEVEKNAEIRTTRGFRTVNVFGGVDSTKQEYQLTQERTEIHTHNQCKLILVQYMSIRQQATLRIV